MESEINIEQGITPDELIDIIGITPADNCEGYNTAHAWKSKLVGGNLRYLFEYKRVIDIIAQDPFRYGWLSFASSLQSSMIDFWTLDPVKAYARIASRTGRNADLYSEMNAWIYENYAKLLYNFSGYFIENGRFNREKALHTSTTPEGKQFLRDFMKEFAFLERNYNSLGLTRLKAMKELLKCILIIVTEKSFKNEDPPFLNIKKDDPKTMSWLYNQNPDPADQGLQKYLEENRLRIENLYRENAFDIKYYSERATGGKIGYSPYEYIEGSKMHCVRLRHYFRPEGVQPNNKVLYIMSPLINKPDIYDLSKGKSVVEGLLKEGFEIYLVDHGEAGSDDTELDLNFFGKIVPDFYIDEIVKKRHPNQELYTIGYCMAGTLMLPYLARRAEERLANGQEMDIKKIVLMASPVNFDEADSGHGLMRKLISNQFNPYVMKEMFGTVNIPPEVIGAGMNEIQPGVHYNVPIGFYGRAHFPNAIQDSAPFLYWLTHGTKFPSKAHREWINLFFNNLLVKGEYCISSKNKNFNGKPVNMEMLRNSGVRIFSYRGSRDLIAPPGSCVAAELWGVRDPDSFTITRGGLNRMIEKNVGHIFVVSKQLLAEYLELVINFFRS